AGLRVRAVAQVDDLELSVDRPVLDVGAWGSPESSGAFAVRNDPLGVDAYRVLHLIDFDAVVKEEASGPDPEDGQPAVGTGRAGAVGGREHELVHKWLAVAWIDSGDDSHRGGLGATELGRAESVAEIGDCGGHSAGDEFREVGGCDRATYGVSRD